MRRCGDLGRQRIEAAARLVVPLLGLCVSVGCNTLRIPLEDLPDAPIAMTYWEPSEARKLEEAGGPVAPGGPPSPAAAAREAAIAQHPGRLVLLDPRTREITPVEAAPPGAQALAFSPDHRQLLFRTDRISGRHQIYEVDLDNGELRPLTHGAPHLRADYLADGVVLMRTEEPGSLTVRIQRASRSGGGAATLYETALGNSLRASPDGALLAWEQLGRSAAVTSRAPQWFLVLADAQGSEARTLAPGRDPIFHPDGTWIVYSGPSAGGWQLRRIRTDGTGRAPLGAGGLTAESPAISPDGRYVVYVGRDSLGAKLFVRRFDGTGDRILLGEGKMMAPVW